VAVHLPAFAFGPKLDGAALGGKEDEARVRGEALGLGPAAGAEPACIDRTGRSDGKTWSVMFAGNPRGVRGLLDCEGTAAGRARYEQGRGDEDRADGAHLVHELLILPLGLVKRLGLENAGDEDNEVDLAAVEAGDDRLAGIGRANVDALERAALS
jgi:hypothetical protein